MVTQTTLPPPSVAVRDAIQKTFVPAKVLSGFTDVGHFEMLVGEFMSSLTAAAKTELLAKADKTRQFASALPPFAPSNVVGAEITGPHVDAIRNDPLFAAAFGQRPFKFAWVDVTQVVALQPWIEPRADPIPSDQADLLAFALPHAWEVPAEVSFIQPNGPIQLFTSNPAMQGLEVRADTASSTVILGTLKHINLVQVVHFNGRHYLRNGYHRAADALAAGVHQLPAIVTEALAFPQDIQLANYGAFSAPHLVGLTRPPLVADFKTRAALKAKVRERRYGIIVSLDVKQISIGI